MQVNLPGPDYPQVRMLSGPFAGKRGRITKHYIPTNHRALGQKFAWWIEFPNLITDAGASCVLAEDYDEAHGLWYTADQFEVVYGQTVSI